MAVQPDLFVLAFDAFMRPARYARYLAGGRDQVVWACLGTALWVGVGLAFVPLVLGQLAPLGVGGYIGALVYAPLLGLMVAGLLIIVSGPVLSPAIATPFWITRCLLVIVPSGSLLLGLAMSVGFAPQLGAWAPLIFLVCMGAWIGGGIGVLLTLSKARDEAPGIRAVLGTGLAVIALLSWLAPSLRAGAGPALAPFCAGLAVGLIRPLSWLWQAPTSLLLDYGAWLGMPANRLFEWHPVQFDELCLLPQPRLASLLRRLCVADSEHGTARLIAVGTHPTQSAAAGQAIERLVRERRSAHAVLFRLSTEPEGAALLAELVSRARHPSELVCTYSGLAAVDDQASWGAVLKGQRASILRYADMPGGAAVLSLLAAGDAVLTADRYAVATQALALVPRPAGVVKDELWSALEALIDRADDREASWGVEPGGQGAVLAEVIAELDGWPSQLLAAIAEHFSFLEHLDRPGGAV